MRYIGSKRLTLQDDDFDDIMFIANKNGLTLPSDPSNILRLIIDMKAIGLWSALDNFYVFAGDGGSDFKCLNLVNPSVFDAVPYNSPVFSNGGVSGGVSKGYLSTQINPTNASLKAKQNNSLLMTVVKTAIPSDGAGGAKSAIWGLETFFDDYFSTARNFRRLNGYFNEETTSNSAGLFAIARTGSTTGWATQKSVEQTLTNSSNYLLNNTRTILRANTSYGTGTVSCYASGESVSQSVMQSFRSIYDYYLLMEGELQIS